jgi:hypothetical protein
MSIVYRSEQNQLVIPTLRKDFDTTSALFRVSPDDARIVFGRDIDPPFTPKRAEDVAASAERLLELLENDPKLTTSWVFDHFIPTNPPIPMVGVAGVTAIRLGDNWYMLEGGIGRCDLCLFSVGEDGKGTLVSQTDISNQTLLETDNKDTITIRTVRVKTRLPSHLRKIIDFAHAHSGKDIFVIGR